MNIICIFINVYVYNRHINWGNDKKNQRFYNNQFSKNTLNPFQVSQIKFHEIHLVYLQQSHHKNYDSSNAIIKIHIDASELQ